MGISGVGVGSSPTHGSNFGVYSMNLVEKAKLVAATAHLAVKQTRKYSDEPYIVHPEEVAAMVATVPHTPEMLAAAWLHDSVEDTGVTLEFLDAVFGTEVTSLVEWLTDVEHPGKNRATRKKLSCERWFYAPDEAKTIKLADILSNFKDIAEKDHNFAQVYFRELHDLLPNLRGGDATLMARAREMLEKYSGIVH
jgi:(p)ppGpp synthase/HD superfamily hydrolase